MENSLLGAGVACVIAAIVGGGLKAFGLEMPLVNSIRRQVLLGLFGVTLVIFSMVPILNNVETAIDKTTVTKSLNVLPHLSFGTWTLQNAIDNDGKNWSDSTLKFTSQEATSDGLNVKGEFTWRLDGVSVGTEDFAGNYIESTRQLIFEGRSVKDFSTSGNPRLAVGSYAAVLSTDERSLSNGRWGSTMTNVAGVAGKWEATR